MPINRSLVRQEVKTYAQCLLSAAQDNDHVIEDIDELQEAYKAINKSSELRNFLQDDNMAAESKSELIEDILTGFSPEVLGVVSTLAQRGEITMLGRVCSAYEDAVEEVLNAVIVDVTTAVPLDDHLREVLISKLSDDLGHQVRLNETVDPSILGGFIVDTHGKRMDASVRTRLTNARRVLTSYTTGGEI